MERSSGQDTLSQNDKDKLRIRRRMAITSFIVIVTSIPVILLMCFFGGSVVADNLLKASGVITPLYLFLTGVVMQYGHYSQQQDMNNKEDKSKV